MPQARIAHDITLPIDERLPLYPGDEPAEVRRLCSVADGDALTASELRLGCHIGTHVDAPAHFLAGGATLTELPLESFHGPACVLDFPALESIRRADVAAQAIPRRSHLLLKTRNWRLLAEPGFRSDYCFLEREATEALLALEPLSIGIDYYSLDPPDDETFPAHRAVAERGLPAFVCLNLAAVEPGEYELQAWPLPISGLEGLPVRAVLFRGV